MKRENINYFVVGVFVLVLLAAFFLVLYKLTGRTGPTDEYYVTYENVAGIKYGTPVLYEGYQIGQVEVIEPVRETSRTSYRLTFSVTKDWKIPEDSIAAIVASGLLSAITINIKEGTSQSALNPGDEIRGEEASSIFDAVNEVAGSLNEITEEGIQPLIQKVNRHVDSIANELSGLIKDDVRPMVQNVNKELDQKILKDLKSLLEQLNEGSDRLLVLLNDENQQNVAVFLENMEQASGSLNDILIAIDDTREAMDDVLMEIDGLIENNEENINSSIRDMQKSLNIIAQHISAIIHHLEGSTRNVHELSRQVRENPSLILRGSPQPDAGEQ